MPTPTSLSFSPGLTSLAVEVQNKAYVGDLVLPHMAVAGKSGKYKSYSVEDQFDIDGGLLGPTSKADEIDYDVTETRFTLDDFGKVGFVSQQEIDNAEAPLQPLQAMTRKVTDRVLRIRERRVALAVMNTDNYATGNKLDVAGAWATTTTDIWGQMLTALDATMAPTNVMVMDIATMRAVQRNTKILEAIKGTLAPQFIEQARGPAKTGHARLPDSVFLPALATALGIDRVLVGAAWYKTSKKGQTFTRGRMWDLPNAGKGGCALLRVAQDQIEDVIWGAQFMWKQPLRVMTWFENDPGADGSTAIKVVETTKIQTIADDAGYLFFDTMAT